MMYRALSLALTCAAALAVSGCMSMPQDGRNSLPTTTSLAYLPKKTQTQNILNQLPSPQRPVAIAVYGFTDQTGQFKPSETGQTLSRAVTQGASSMLVEALQDSGNRGWFTVVERERLDNLLRERQIIGEMRKRYLGEQEIDPAALPALLFAGVLLEGGIVGYDTNAVTGGAGAAFLGIAARTEYRQDNVTVYLRAVSVRTGEVLANVTASKTIASQALGASAFKFVAFRELQRELSSAGETSAAVLQRGSGNTIILVQDGSDNSASLDQVGDDNALTATQLNSGNRLEWSQTGDGLADLGITQTGNGSLQVTQSITGAQFAPAPGSGG